ncbi:MAG: GAF domain-containing protein [Chloroflexi bacterium]|nr:GAF domain-containing protein [Chloroflexota bacterium]
MSTIAVTEGLLSPALQRTLVARGLQVEPLALPPPGGAIRLEEPSPVQRPRVALLAAAALPGAPDEAYALLGRLRAEGWALVLVGAVPAAVAPLVAEEVHAWLPLPVEELPLVAALRSALAADSLRSELARAREELDRKEAEARSLYEVGTALSTERDLDRLQGLILRRCRELTRADAGSLYLLDEGQNQQRVLRFEVAQNDSVQSSYQRLTMPLDEHSLAGYVALTGRTLNLADAYDLPAGAPYRFNHTFDERMGYRTRSMLVVPLRNHEGDVIAVLQLINCKRSFRTRLASPEAVEREVVAFPPQAEAVLGAFASQAAVALDNRLLLESIERLFEDFVHAAVSAIEARDPTTAGHSERVAELALGLAQAVNERGGERWQRVHFSQQQVRELRYAGLLHDFGKIGVREHVLVKARKLYEGQLEAIRLRFVLARQAMEVDHLRAQLALALEQGAEAGRSAGEALAEEHRRRLRELDEDLATVVAANEPTVLDQASSRRLAEIAALSYRDAEGQARPLLDPAELGALSVRRGSLSEAERREIESHVAHTYHVLSLMPWTRELRAVPLIAGAHHEKLDGSGYPRGLKADEIPLQSRMLAIADIYDALTASDRPYKRAVPPEKALDILRDEARLGHLDPDLLDLFIERQIYQVTAHDRQLVASG